MVVPKMHASTREMHASRRARLGAGLCVLASGATCLLSPTPAARALTSEEGAPSAPALSALVEQCVTASTAGERSVTFTGQMETVAGAHRMAMQIVVEEHTPGEAGFHTLTAPGLGGWQRSEVGVKIYKYVRQVTDLPAPASFRAQIEYRWTNERGHVIRTDERRTSICHEPGQHPKPPATAPSSGGRTGSGGVATTPGSEATPTAGSTALATLLRR